VYFLVGEYGEKSVGWSIIDYFSMVFIEKEKAEKAGIKQLK
jgi:hypothetical protein